MEKLNYSDFSDSGSEDINNPAMERVHKIMDEIYANQDKIKTDDDLDRVANHCTDMIEKMVREQEKNKSAKKKPAVGRASVAGGDYLGTDRLKKTLASQRKKSVDLTDLSSLIEGPSLKDLMNKKKEKLKTGEVLKQKSMGVKEVEKPKPKESVKGKSSKSKAESDWRAKIEKILETQNLSGSSEQTSEDSGSDLDSEEEKLFQKAMSSEKEKNQFEKHKSAFKEAQKQFRPSKEDFEIAKKKAEDWLKDREAALAKDGKLKAPVEESSSEEDSDEDNFVPSKLNIPKRDEDPLAALRKKLASMEGPKSTSATAKKTVPPSPSVKKTPISAVRTKKPVASPVTTRITPANKTTTVSTSKKPTTKRI